MYISANHQSHMNITESRKAAVKKMTRRTGMAFYLSGNKTPKSHVVMAIRSGYLDGFYYQVDLDAQTVKVLATDAGFQNTLFLHKIGN